MAPYLESIWVQQDFTHAALQNYPPTRVLPTTKIDVIFHFGDPFVQLDNGQTKAFSKFYIEGQKTKFIDVMATGQTGIIIFCFYPWGLAPFLEPPVAEFTDAAIDLNLVMNPTTISSIENRIEDTRNKVQQVKIIQDFLIDILDARRQDELIVEAVSRINSAKNNTPVSKIAADLGISRRHFIRRFKRTVGITPKKFSNIIRFQKAMYLKRLGMNWSDIMFRCGYYDQSHFIKEINHFSGYTPQNIHAATSRTELMKFFNKDRNLSHFYNTIYL